MSDEELHSTASHQLSIDWLITGMRSSAPPRRLMGKLLCTVIRRGGAGLSSLCPFFRLLPFHFRPLLIKFATRSVKSPPFPSCLFHHSVCSGCLPPSLWFPWGRSTFKDKKSCDQSWINRSASFSTLLYTETYITCLQPVILSISISNTLLDRMNLLSIRSLFVDFHMMQENIPSCNLITHLNTGNLVCCFNHFLCFYCCCVGAAQSVQCSVNCWWRGASREDGRRLFLSEHYPFFSFPSRITLASLAFTNMPRLIIL